MSGLAIEELQGEYAFYDEPDRWVPKYERQIERRRLTPYQIGQMIFGNHRAGRFRAEVAEKTTVAGSAVRLKLEGVTPYAPLAIITGRLDGPPPEAFGRIVFPFEETLDVLIRIPEDAESGTYIFFGQQWEPGGQPAYPGGGLIYLSAVASVEVRPHIDAEAFWGSFEPWSKQEGDEVRENIRRFREGLRG
ncbi:MAG: hypothetical protein H0T57_18030 [Rubrobacter sp.]|nr:hypothetical protein [Rubrobacter sp.]MDQ3637117.1 hypothetical protein [Actinomycetota bacterium]